MDPDGFAAIAYHPNGMWSLLSHGSGVTMAQNNDPFSMRRPNRIFNIGVLIGTPFDSGNYAYL